MSPAACGGIGAMSCRVLAPIEWPSLRHREGQQKEPGDDCPTNHQSHRPAYRHRHDAASVPAFCRDLVSRTTSRGLRDARSILGHGWSKTTGIYAGSSSRRASRAYNEFLFKQREELKLSVRSRSGDGRHMRTLKHLPLDEWPEADREAFKAAYEAGDVFDETAGPGAHLAEGTRRMIETPIGAGSASSRRTILMISRCHRPSASRLGGCAPSSTISAPRSRASSVALVVQNLYYAARLIAPTTDWAWLRSLKSRLVIPCPPEDRFDRLVPPWCTLDFGIELMGEALKLPITGHKQREIQYRDGLIGHAQSLADTPPQPRGPHRRPPSRIRRLPGRIFSSIRGHQGQARRRASGCRAAPALSAALSREIRPRLLGGSNHDGLWASYQGRPLSGGRIYDIARARITKSSAKPWGFMISVVRPRLFWRWMRLRRSA